MNNKPLPEIGQRIMCISMPGDSYPIPPGTRGTVTGVHNFTTCAHVSVKWDNGRTLSLLSDVDKWEAV